MMKKTKYIKKYNVIGVSIVRNKDYLYGIMNSQGIEIVPCQYERMI